MKYPMKGKEDRMKINLAIAKFLHEISQFT